MKHFSAAKIVIWLACMLLAGGAARAEGRWVFVGEFDKVGSVYVTPAAKSRQAWMKFTTPEGQTKSITLMEFDCASKQYRSFEMTKYDVDGVPADVIKITPSWREAVPDTAIEATLDLGCKLKSENSVSNKTTSEIARLYERKNVPSEKNKTEPFRLPDNFIDCSKDNGEFCSSTELFDEMQKQLIDIDGSNTFYFRSRDDTLPYRLKRRVSEATDGQVPLTIYVDALWQGLRVKEIFGEYEGWGMTFDATLEDVRQALLKNGAQISSEGCGVHVFESEGATGFYSGC